MVPVLEFHHVLHVVYPREVKAEEVEKLRLRGGKRATRQQFQQIPKVVPRVKRDPPHFVTQNHPTDHQQLPEPKHVDSPLRMRLEVDARVFQQLDGILRVHVLLERKLPEVELPHAVVVADHGQNTVRVRQSQTELNQLQHVHVAPGG